jgi:pseudouridine-5'-phosphate glycosidase
VIALLAVSAEVAAAVAAGRPVVALETTVVTHGLPAPLGVQTAAAM